MHHEKGEPSCSPFSLACSTQASAVVDLNTVRLGSASLKIGEQGIGVSRRKESGLPRTDPLQLDLRCDRSSGQFNDLFDLVVGRAPACMMLARRISSESQMSNG